MCWPYILRLVSWNLKKRNSALGTVERKRRRKSLLNSLNCREHGKKQKKKDCRWKTMKLPMYEFKLTRTAKCNHIPEHIQICGYSCCSCSCLFLYFWPKAKTRYRFFFFRFSFVHSIQIRDNIDCLTVPYLPLLFWSVGDEGKKKSGHSQV